MSSEYWNELYDTVTGGPPRAFECVVCTRRALELDLNSSARSVTPTLRGMKLHLARVHGWQIQPKLFDDRSNLAKTPARATIKP